MKTRHVGKYHVSQSNGKRYENIAIPKMIHLVNKEYKDQKQMLRKLKKVFCHKQTLPVPGFIVEIINLLLLLLLLLLCLCLDT